MELIERYLAAVRLLLPFGQRDDIAAELRDALLTRREEKEAELGRPLTKGEEEALLKAFGHPLAVAGRYGGEQYLIGPELYHLYVFVLKIVLAVIAASAIVTGVVDAVVENGALAYGVRTAIAIAWNGAWGAVGAVTIAFAVLQRPAVKARLFANWNPRDLPRPARARRRSSWLDHAAGIVVQVIFLLWWTRVIQLWQPTIPLKTGGSLTVALGPVWQGTYWPVIALSVGIIAVNALKLFGGVSRRVAYGLDIVVQAGMLGLAGFLLRFRHWVVVTGAGVPARTLTEVTQGLTIAIAVALASIAFAAAGVIVYDAFRLLRPDKAAA